MPFGLKMSQDIFQMKIDQTHGKCKTAIGIADDIRCLQMTTHMSHIYMKSWKGLDEQVLNSSLVYVVLALDSLNYCSGEQDLKAQHIHNIVQPSLYSCTNIYKWQIKCCHLMLNPFATRLHTSSDLMKPFVATLRGRCWDVGPCSPEQ